MDNTEAKIMAMTLERELLVRQHVAEGRVRRALAERPDRVRGPVRDGVLRRAWGVADGVRHTCRRWLAMPWDEPSSRGTAAVASEA
jgi:hypothetical protein